MERRKIDIDSLIARITPVEASDAACAPMLGGRSVCSRARPPGAAA